MAPAAAAAAAEEAGHYHKAAAVVDHKAAAVDIAAAVVAEDPGCTDRTEKEPKERGTHCCTTADKARLEAAGRQRLEETADTRQVRAADTQAAGGRSDKLSGQEGLEAGIRLVGPGNWHVEVLRDWKCYSKQR